MKILTCTSEMDSAGGYASQTPHKAHSRVDTHSGKLWPYSYTGNWA